MNWTAAELLLARQRIDNQGVKFAKASASKYHNVKTEVDGVKFDSRKEATRYGHLVLLEKKGEIKDLKRQVPFEIVVNGQKICKYIADATYFVGEKLIVEDTKSDTTRKLPVYRMKKKLLAAVLNIQIKEV